MRKVEIIWKDIRSDDGWHEATELDDFISADNNTVKQVAYVLEEDDEQIVLIDSYFTDKQLFGSILKIPKGCVVSVTELE